MKKHLILIIILVISGCASKPRTKRPPNTKIDFVTLTSHPEYGKVQLPNDEFNRDEAACKAEIYSKGVTIEGKIEKDHEIIEKYLKQHFIWKLTNIRKGLKEVNNLSGAHAGTMGALAVTTGNPSLGQNNYKKSSNQTPNGYFEAERVWDDRKNCVVSKGWSELKLEKIYCNYSPLSNVKKCLTAFLA